jgi:hypothetical protein
MNNQPVKRGLKVPKKYIPELKLDWEAYYSLFTETHGEPVQVDGVLLFQDGWRYSCLDHAGPEYPPPKDEKRLRKLQLTYWTVVKRQYVGEAYGLRRKIEGLEQRGALSSLPLQQKLRIPTEDGKGMRWSEPGDLDLRGLKYHLRDLESLIALCDRELENLNKGDKEE